MEITIKDILQLCKKNLIKIAVFTECVVIIASLFTFCMMPDEFTSEVQFYVLDKQSDTQDSFTTGELTVSLALVNDYNVLMKSRTVKAAAAERVGLEDLDGYSISVAAASSNSRVVKVTVTGNSASMTANVANSLYLEFKEAVIRIMGVENVNVVDDARIASAPSGPGREKLIIIAGFAALVLCIVFIVICDMLDTTVKTADDIEAQIGIPVLCQVPKVEIDANGKRKGHKKKK